jgi:hypothetical protein
VRDDGTLAKGSHFADIAFSSTAIYPGIVPFHPPSKKLGDLISLPPEQHISTIKKEAVSQ